MHKLTFYLNNDQYRALEVLSEEKGYESAEEAANEVLYSEIRRRWHHKLNEDLLKNSEEQVDQLLIKKLTPSCPHCGGMMIYTKSEEGVLNYECVSCGAEARVCPTPDSPDLCKVEFSKDHFVVEARRRNPEDHPGYVVTVTIYAAYDIACVDVESKDAENLTICDLGKIAERAYSIYRPFAERYLPTSIEKSLAEYSRQRNDNL